MMRRPGAPRAFTLVTMAATAILAGCIATDDISGPSGWTPGTTYHAIAVGGLTRTYVLHVPAHRAQSSTGMLRPYSLLILLHGSSGNGEAIEHASQMDSLSEVHHFVVAYPDGYKGAGGLFPSDWNAGTCCGASGRENIDDLAFIAQTIADVSHKLPIDAHRIYVAGFSDGGRMAYHAACQLSNTVAAIGVVSGSLRDDHCVPARSVPVIAVHGTSDDQVAYDDSALTAPLKPVPTVAGELPSSLQFWAAENGCSTANVTHPSAHVVETALGACTGAVVFYSIDGGEHGWPGEPDGVGSEPPMSELSGSRAIVEFLMRQKK